MGNYQYKPIRFYITTFIFTWGFWIAGIFASKAIALSVVFFGLCVPAVIAVVTVMRSKNTALKADFKRKLLRFHKLSPRNIVAAIVVYGLIVGVSIVASVLFAGQSWQQFSVEDFSFSISGSSALLTILLASILEEIGWRGYGEDAIASYCTWFKESVLFGMIWSC